MLVAIGGIVAVSLVGFAQSEISSEADYEATMKEVGATFRSVRQDMEARDGQAVIAGTTKLAMLFEQVQAFWESRGVDNASSFATKAHDAASAIRAAVESQNFQAIAPARDALGAVCQSCHAEFREEVDGGGYRIKSGVL